MFAARAVRRHQHHPDLLDPAEPLEMEMTEHVLAYSCSRDHP